MNDNDTLADDLRKDSLALMKLLADEKHKSEALAAELAVEKMQHSVTIADEHESRSEFQDRIRALESSLAAELALRQTAEAYAARNALRVIEVESVLRSAHAELTDHGHQELPECECRIAHVLAGSQTETPMGWWCECGRRNPGLAPCQCGRTTVAETKRKCPECVYDVGNPFVCERCGTPMGPTVAETACTCDSTLVTDISNHQPHCPRYVAETGVIKDGS